MHKIILTVAMLFVATSPMLAADIESSDTAQVATGRYIYIPDSLEQDVIRLLRGHAMVVDDSNNLDLKEQTVYKGDTIPMVLKSRNLGRYDRGLSNILYAPKGQWTFGLTAAYGSLSTQDLEIFDLLSNINIGVTGYQIKPYIAYFIRNNLSIGLRFGYTNLKGNIDSFSVDIDEDMSFSLNDISYSQENYSAALTASQFVGLARHGRFGLYNEIELAFSSGNSQFKRPYAGEPRTTYTTTMQAALNFSPGLQVFVMKNASFHVSFSTFGLYIKNAKQRDDDGEFANRFTSGASFRFNLFNINFGIGIHI